MEALVLTCLQANLIWGKVSTHPHLTPQMRNDLLYELRLITPKKCSIDANAD
jgi:hypothetical protein